ncbi:MAG TPA: hypothetical protein PLJ47_17050, partial [Candidatus Hydrogenedentes bacterium]|nr:hypothetical protein [Candidatus Hydrogenedentota bacterium]
QSEHELLIFNAASGNALDVPQICPGEPGSYPAELTVAGDTLFFRANDGVRGEELWAIDAKNFTPRLVKDILPNRIDAPVRVVNRAAQTSSE